MPKWLKNYSKGFSTAEMMVGILIMTLIAAASFAALSGPLATTSGSATNTITNISAGGF